MGEWVSRRMGEQDISRSPFRTFSESFLRVATSHRSRRLGGWFHAIKSEVPRSASLGMTVFLERTAGPEQCDAWNGFFADVEL
jgi:hypothetical protein